MQEYTIVTQGSATYLERTLGADELLDEVDRGMLVSNQISGMLPLNILDQCGLQIAVQYHRSDAAGTGGADPGA